MRLEYMDNEVWRRARADTHLALHTGWAQFVSVKFLLGSVQSAAGFVISVWVAQLFVHLLTDTYKNPGCTPSLMLNPLYIRLRYTLNRVFWKSLCNCYLILNMLLLPYSRSIERARCRALLVFQPRIFFSPSFLAFSLFLFFFDVLLGRY